MSPSHGPTPPAIECRALRRTRAEGFELRVPRFDLAVGQAVACVGPSGTGKSTMLNLLAGLDAPDAGTVRFSGRDWQDLAPDERRRQRLSRIGLIPQGFDLVPHLDALENVCLPRTLGAREEREGDDVRERARALLDAVGLGALERRLPPAMSEGQRQRVAVCRALVLRPAVVLADEPTASLDPEAAEIVHALLFDAARREGSALFVVTHDRAVVSRFDAVARLGPLGGPEAIQDGSSGGIAAARPGCERSKAWELSVFAPAGVSR